MDPKKILGVKQNATPEEIQRAYREKAKKHHPDRGGDGWAFQQVQDAYEALINPKPAAKKNPAAHPPTSSDPSGSNASNRQSTRQPDSRSNKNPANERTKQNSVNDAGPTSQPSHNWKNLFVGHLPLQTETTTFILINCLDIFITYILLTKGAIEANPIADFVMLNWGFRGAIAFKLAIVTVVTVIAQIVAIKKPRTARVLLIAGTFIVGGVVVYSIRLLFRHYGL